jgi:hypothetical protein
MTSANNRNIVDEMFTVDGIEYRGYVRVEYYRSNAFYTYRVLRTSDLVTVSANRNGNANRDEAKARRGLTRAIKQITK